MHVIRYSTNQIIQKDSNIYHINKKGLTILNWKKYRRSLKSISYNRKMIRSIIAPNMIWFVVDTEMFGQDGNPLVNEMKEIYCLNAHLINSEQLETLYNQMISQWLERNSKPFDLSQLEAYRDWGDQILVPAPIPILENQEGAA